MSYFSAFDFWEENVYDKMVPDPEETDNNEDSQEKDE